MKQRLIEGLIWAFWVLGWGAAFAVWIGAMMAQGGTPKEEPPKVWHFTISEPFVWGDLLLVEVWCLSAGPEWA